MTTATKQPKEKTVATHTAKADIDTSKMSVEDMLALADKLKAAAHEQSQKLFDETIMFLGDKLKSMGRTKAEAVNALIELMSNDEREALYASIRGTARAVTKARQSSTGETKQRDFADPKDAAGKEPEPGKTYKFPNGETYTRAKARPSKKFVELMRASGKTWEELKVA